MNAHEVIELLRHHYIAPSKAVSGYFCPELQAPIGTRRADLIWMPMTSYQRGQIIGHEVKVSRSDVQAELSDPMKADAWLQYCTQWWLVVADPALVDGLDIPEKWGVMSPPSGRRRRSMTILRPAPKLEPVDQAQAFATIMARMFYRGDDHEARLKTAREQADRLTVQLTRTQATLSQLQREAQRSAAAAGVSGRNAARVQAILTAVDEMVSDRQRVDSMFLAAPLPEEIAKAIVDLAEARRAAQYLARRVRDDLDAIRQLQRDFNPLLQRYAAEVQTKQSD